MVSVIAKGSAFEKRRAKSHGNVCVSAMGAYVKAGLNKASMARGMFSWPSVCTEHGIQNSLLDGPRR